MKSPLQSKTFWIGLLQIVIGALGLLATFLQAGDFTPASITMLVSGVLMIVLRFVTVEPIGF